MSLLICMAQCSSANVDLVSQAGTYDKCLHPRLPSQVAALYVEALVTAGKIKHLPGQVTVLSLSFVTTEIDAGPFSHAHPF